MQCKATLFYLSLVGKDVYTLKDESFHPTFRIWSWRKLAGSLAIKWAAIAETGRKAFSCDLQGYQVTIKYFECAVYCMISSRHYLLVRSELSGVHSLSASCVSLTGSCVFPTVVNMSAPASKLVKQILDKYVIYDKLKAKLLEKCGSDFDVDKHIDVCKSGSLVLR